MVGWKGVGTMVSTKVNIKKVALSLFATYGYAGTSMKNISDGVGISKASLYSHYSGKEDILFAVYEDLVEDYIQLHNRLFDEAKNMLVSDQLEHLFKGYILHYYQNREVQAFWEQVTFLTPPEIREKILSNLAEIDQHIHDKMVEIFQQAMDQQLIRKDHPTKMVVSFRSMRDGLLKWMLIIPKIKVDLVSSFWSDFWYGLETRNNKDNGGI